jgi:hypothetical protein
MNRQLQEENQLWKVALINLVANLGLDAAISIADGIKNAKSIDDAIEALKATQQLDWQKFKAGPQ